MNVLELLTSLELDETQVQYLKEMIDDWPRMRGRFPRNILHTTMDGHVHVAGSKGVYYIPFGDAGTGEQQV